MLVRCRALLEGWVSCQLFRGHVNRLLIVRERIRITLKRSPTRGEKASGNCNEEKG